MIIEQIQQFIPEPQRKTLLEVGSHDDSLTKEFARYFKHVSLLYEFLKIDGYTRGNIKVDRLPYSVILSALSTFDVLLFVNEFHHFPDIQQLQTFASLQPHQVMLLAEFNGTGNENNFYSCFQNCTPLVQLTQYLLQQAIRDGYVTIKGQVSGFYETSIGSKEEMIQYFRFMLPDHWKFGEKRFMEKIHGLTYPLVLKDGYTLFKIVRTSL